MTSSASARQSSFRAYTQSGGLQAAATSNLRSTNRSRTQATVARPTSSASTVRPSLHAGSQSAWSALSRMRAWASSATAARPRVSRPSSSAHSSGVSVTRYFFVRSVDIVRPLCRKDVQATHLTSGRRLSARMRTTSECRVCSTILHYPIGCTNGKSESRLSCSVSRLSFAPDDRGPDGQMRTKIEGRVPG